MATAMNSQSSPHDIFQRLLDESSALLTAPGSAGIAIPEDELHREIIVPLLPALLGDKAIRGHWSEQAATGFVARIGRHFEHGDPAPRWKPGDFEIHVTASYSAGADARALADTLLSEDSLRDMTAALMNQLLDAVWPSLAPAATAPEPEPVIEVAPVEIPAPIASPEPESVPPVPGEIMETLPTPADEQEIAVETPAALPTPSLALIRALCRKLSASAVQRGLAARGAANLSAAILARRILQSAAGSVRSGPTNRRPHITSPRRLPRRASL